MRYMYWKIFTVQGWIPKFEMVEHRLKGMPVLCNNNIIILLVTN